MGGPPLTCRCCGRFRVELIRLDRGAGPRQVLKVTSGPYLVAYARTVAEVARHVDRAVLVDA